MLLNGKSLGSKKLADFPDYVIKWDVPFQSGNLKVIGKKAGKKVAAYELKTALAPEKIILKPDTTFFKTNGEDVSIIEVYVVDKNGTVVPDASNEIIFSVEGVGTLMGTSNGNLADNVGFTSSTRKAYFGKCLAVVKIPGNSGIVQITASSENLKKGEVKLEIE